MRSVRDLASHDGQDSFFIGRSIELQAPTFLVVALLFFLSRLPIDSPERPVRVPFLFVPGPFLMFAELIHS